jgi:siderophore synthetase component
MRPLLDHGIALEAHGQNIVARICTSSKTIKGFAVRDFGGIRLYMPKLHSQGFDLPSIPPGSAITSHNLHDVWNKVHHSLFQNHLGQLIIALGLEERGGWAVVREELENVVRPGESQEAADLWAYFVQDKMVFKCFLRMKMEGKYRDVSFPFRDLVVLIIADVDFRQYIERRVPNVLLS